MQGIRDNTSGQDHQETPKQLNNKLQSDDFHKYRYKVIDDRFNDYNFDMGR